MSRAQLSLRVLLTLLLFCFLLFVDPGFGPLTSHASGDSAQRAQQLLELSEEQNYQDHALALKTAHEALILYQSLNDNDGIARSYAQIARYHFAQRDLVEATQNYETAVEMWRVQGKTREQAELLIMLGYIEDRKRDFPAAIARFTQAQGLMTEQSGPQLKGQVASGLAYVFNESGIPESGLVKYQQALDYYKQAGNERFQNRMIMALGYTYYLLKDNKAALSHLQQALETFKSEPLDAAECHEYLARLHFDLGDYAAALDELQPTIVIYEKAGNRLEAAQVQALIAQIYQQQAAIDKARALYLDSLKTFQQLTDQVDEAAVYFALGRLELKRKNYDAAEEYLKQSVVNTENIRHASSGRDLTAAFSANVHARYEAYIECLMRKHQLKPAEGFDIKAFEASELARARSLAVLLRDTQTNLAANVEPQLAKQEKSLRQSIRAREDQKIALLGTVYKKEELDAVEKTIQQNREDYKRVVEEIRKTDPAFELLSQPTSYTLKQVQGEVLNDDQTALVEYSLGDDASFAWIVTRNTIKGYELAREELITESARKLYNVLSTRPDANYDGNVRTAADELGKLVLAPLTDQPAVRRLIVVADGALSYIPFQSLPSQSNGQQLIADREIVNAPSASVLGQLRVARANRRSADNVLAAFGDAQFTSNPASESAPWQKAVQDIQSTGARPDGFGTPLFYAKIELANLAKIAGPQTFVATGVEASREKLESTDLTRYAILHFATHGIFDPKRPEFSGLLLSTVNNKGAPVNGFVSIQDVYSLQTPVDLVVLSACHTGLGKDVRGEGLIGLTRGFMYAGASSVVASLWRVDDEATAELMKQFYENMLQRRMTPAASLRAAQNTIRQQPQWRSPYYWAGFTIQGEYQQTIDSPVRSNVRSYTLITLLLVVGLLGTLTFAIWWYYRNRQRRLIRL